MKKLLCMLLALSLLLSLAACGGKSASKEAAPSKSAPTASAPAESEAPAPAKSEAPADGDTLEGYLAKIGLKLSDIEPQEAYYRAGFDKEDGIIFLMEKGTEKNTGAFIKKVYDACAAVSDDGKIYDADMAFFMNTDPKVLELPPEEEINKSYFYLAQFGFYYKGEGYSITLSNVDEYDDERNDDKSYPSFSFAFNG